MLRQWNLIMHHHKYHANKQTISIFLQNDIAFMYAIKVHAAQFDISKDRDICVNNHSKQPNSLQRDTSDRHWPLVHYKRSPRAFYPVSLHLIQTWRLTKEQEFFRSKNSHFLQIELQVIAIVLLVAVAVQAENCQVAGTPLFSYFSIGFEFSISNISRKKSWFLFKLQLSF